MHLIIFFPICKKCQITIMKNTKKDSEKKHAKDMKIFLKKKQTKAEKTLEKDIKLLLNKKKKKGETRIFLRIKK